MVQEKKLGSGKMSKTQHQHQPNQPSCHPGKKEIDIFFWGSLFFVSVLFILAFIDTPSQPWLTTLSLSVYHMVHSIWWGVAIGALFIGLLSKVPREFILSILGKGGSFNGLLRSAGAGVLLDLCSHGILMVAVKLYERGASAGQVIAFLLASPWNSFSLTLVLIGLIGLFWTMVFILLSLVIAIITGWFFELFVKRGILPANHNQVELPEGFQFWKNTKIGISATKFDFQFFKEVILDGIIESKMVVRWLLFGILLASVIRIVLDPAQFQNYFGPTFTGLAITIIVATIIEVCSEGSTPLATDILNRAHAPGNGFAFLMSGVATDYTEIAILKDTTKSWKIALFLPLITVPQVIIIAALLNMSF